MDGYFGNFAIRKAAACWKGYSESSAGLQVSMLVVKTCTTVANMGEKQGEAGVKRGGLMVRTSAPGEVTGKWRGGGKHGNKQFLYLSTSESEESLSSDLEAEEEQDREGQDGERKGLTTLKERQGYWKDVTGNEFKRRANR